MLTERVVSANREVVVAPSRFIAIQTSFEEDVVEAGKYLADKIQNCALTAKYLLPKSIGLSGKAS